jgi:hypothetical protein
MESLFARIEQVLESSGVSGSLVDQIANLGSTGDLLKQLTSDPPSELGQMVTALNGLSLPEIEPLRNLVGDLKQLSQRVPSDPTQLTGGLGEGLDQLATALQGDLLGPLTQALDVVRAVADLVGGASNTPSALLGGLDQSDVVRAAAAASATGPTSVALAEIDAALDGLPSPLTVENVLPVLRNLFRALPSELIPGARVPIVSEFQNALDTVLAWHDLDGVGLAATLASTLQSLADFIRRSIVSEAQRAAGTVQGLDAQLQPIGLRAHTQALEQGLRDLAGVVTSGNLSTVPARIQQLTTQVGQINAALALVSSNILGGQSDALVGTLDALPNILDGRMRDVLVVLDPPPPVSTSGAADTIDAVWNQTEVDALVANIQGGFDGLAALVGGLNLEVLRGPLETVITGAQATVDELDDLLVQLTSTVALLFDEVDHFVDGLDVAAVTRAVEDALTSIRDLITQQIGALFEPVRAALAGAITTLSAAASAFNAAAIIDALRELIHGFTGVLDDPQVRSALEQAQQALDQAAQALRSLSLKPVTDAVIADIEKVTQTLEKIDPDTLPDPLRDALRAAVSVLPTDFTPITHALTERFDDLVESGPKPLLISIQDQPQALVTRIQTFSPTSLIGDQISAPYQQLVGELAAFKPSDLLEPVHQGLDDLQARLQEMSPGSLLQPLEELHDSLVAAFANLSPTSLIAPLTSQVDGVIDTVVARIPEDEIVNAIQPVLTVIQDVTNTVSIVRALFERLQGMLDVGTPEQQIEQLVSGVLAKVDQIPNLAVLQPGFAGVREALAASRAAQLQPQVLSPLGVLVDRVTTLDPARLHASVVRAYRDFPRSTVQALPPSPERDQILSFLNTFDPLATSFARPFAGLQDWRAQLDTERTRLVDFFAGWDGLYHRPDGPLADFDRDGVTAQQLRDLLRDAIEPDFVQPLTVVFELLGRLQGLLAGLVTGLGRFVDAVQAQTDSLALIPQAVQAIRDALHALVDTLRALNLAFLSDQLQGVFDRVKAKLDDLDPARIRDAVDATFDQVMASLQLDALLPRPQIDQLDATYKQVLDTLRALDPGQLIADVVQPEFEAAIQPLLDLVATLSDLVKALVERLDGLESELDQELGRTADAFSKMLQAVPA